MQSQSGMPHWSAQLPVVVRTQVGVAVSVVAQTGLLGGDRKK